MIIDTHTHLGEFYSLETLTPVQLRNELHSLGVSKAVVFTGNFHQDPRCGNNILAEQIKDLKDFYIPWATVHPSHGTAAVDELRRAILELGFRGLKLHPWLQGFSVSSPIMDAIIEETITLDIPVTFHDGTPPYTSPLQIAELARRFPKARIILAHSGLRDLWQDALLAGLERENLWLGFPGPPLLGMRRIVKDLGASRILYGSDGGIGHPSAIAYALRIINQLDITDTAREKILSENARDLLGI